MPVPVDPFLTLEPLLVVTSSGARHLLVAGEAGTVTITRLAPDNSDAFSGGRGGLRRDGQPIELRAVTHPENGHLVNGILEGVEMCLELEPLRPDAVATLRITTKVVSVQRLAIDAITDLVELDEAEPFDWPTGATVPQAVQPADTATGESLMEPAPPSDQSSESHRGTHPTTNNGVPAEPANNAVREIAAEARDAC